LSENFKESVGYRDDTLREGLDIGMSFLASSAKRIMIVFPNEEKFFLSDEAFEALKRAYDVFYDNNDWLECANIAVTFKMMAPDKFSELRIDKKFWQGIRKEVGHEIAWTSPLVEMKIISAARVEVTDNGIEIVMSERDFAQKKASRPVRKKF